MIIKVAALCIRNNKLLVVKSKNKPVYFSLGGKVEPGETYQQCLEREVLEEVGCRVLSSIFYKTFTGPGYGPNVQVQMPCFLTELEGEPIPSNEIESCAWIDSNFSKDTTFSGAAGMLTAYIIPSLVKDGLLP